MTANAKLQWVLIVGLLLALYFMRGVGSSGLARARIAEERVEVLRAERDSVRATNAALEASVAALDAQYVLDSAQWAQERAEAFQATGRRRRAARATADSLRAQLDPVEDGIFEQYIVQRDSVDAAYEVTVAILSTEVVALGKLRVTNTQLIKGLQSELLKADLLTLTLTEANDALHDAIRSANRQNRVLKLATVALIGVAGWRLVVSPL